MSLPLGIKIQIDVEPLRGGKTRIAVYAVHGTAKALLASKDYEKPEKAWKRLAALAREQVVEIGLEREVVSDG